MYSTHAHMINDWHHMFGIRGQSATPTVPLIAHTIYPDSSVVKFGVSKHQTLKHQTHASVSRPQTPSVTQTNTTNSIESGVSKHQPITIPRR